MLLSLKVIYPQLPYSWAGHAGSLNLLVSFSFFISFKAVGTHLTLPGKTQAPWGITERAGVRTAVSDLPECLRHTRNIEKAGFAVKVWEFGV